MGISYATGQAGTGSRRELALFQAAVARMTGALRRSEWMSESEIETVNSHAATRERLLLAAIRVFAEKGYAEASTREICRLAGVNLAAIHYHFNDKASLYRAVFRLPDQLVQLPPELADDALPGDRVLAAFFRHLMGFVAVPDQNRHLRLLFVREQIQPSGVLDERPGLMHSYHAGLLSFLQRWLGVPEPDLALHQLAFSLLGLSMVMVLERKAVADIAPALLESPAALAATAERLTEQAKALVAAERRRRSAPRATRGECQ